uniref:Pdf n=1 Tax=Platynereis dumerilii TaxID=6359 RepID=G8Z9G4_PLADU|nr:Pdf [Platynereis dumerilii]
MGSSKTVQVAVVVCLVSMFVMQVVCYPTQRSNLRNSLTDADRQEILRYAAKIARIAMGDNVDFKAGPNKRNPGTLDAVLDMPDLMSLGRK